MLQFTENGLIQGRTRLIDLYAGERFKVKTIDGNSVDTMVVDRRHTHSNGDTLVICCEGNAGFYEIGTMVTPIESGYSVLGWNHPGFGGSTVSTTWISQWYSNINKLKYKICSKKD